MMNSNMFMAQQQQQGPLSYLEKTTDMLASGGDARR